MIRFHFLTGDVNYLDYGGKWISNVQNNGSKEDGGFDYYFVIELINWVNSVGEREAAEIKGKPKYNVCLSVVSPHEAGEENIQAAYSCCGIEEEMLESIKKQGKRALAEAQVEVLHSYSGGVSVWQSNGSNWKALMREARQQAQVNGLMFGFAMDRPVNRIGETGWEALKLTDPRTVLDRVIAEHEAATEVALMDKLTPR